MSNDDKYLILGASRGGTTIIASALGSHPSVAILDEEMSGALNKITGGKIPGVKLCIPNQIELDRRWHPLFKLGLMSGYLRKSMIMNRVPLSPLSIRDYDRFGNIRHICIIRHPAGVISAIMNRENRSQKVALYRWRRCLEVFKAIDQDPSYNPVFISFENLVIAPEETLRSLCSEIDLEFAEQMLSAPTRNTRYTSGSFDSTKANYEHSELIWHFLPESICELYKTLNSKAL